MKKLYLAIIAVILVIIAINLFASRGSAQTIENDGRTFSVSFPDSTLQNSQNKQYLVANDGSLVMTVGLSAKKMDCAAGGGKEATKVMIEGKEYPLCRANNSNPESPIYAANFDKHGEWFNATVFTPDMSKAADKDKAVEIISSLKVE